MKNRNNRLLLSLLAIAIVGCSAGNNSSSSRINLNLVPAKDLPQPQNQKVSLTSNGTLTPADASALATAVCQGGSCTWDNSANNNITQGETSAAYCTGTNSSYGGTGYTLGSGAYGMTLPTGIASAKTGYGNTDVILELFNTPYANITTDMLAQYAAMGYTTIWVSPPQYSAYVPYSGTYANDNIPAWYGAYQPIDFGQIGNSSNPLSYGSAADLATLVTNAHNAGLQLIVDVAIHQFAQPGAQTGVASNTATHYYQELSGQTYSYSSGNVSGAIESFYWPQTSVTGYIPFSNIWQGKSSCPANSGTTIYGVNPGSGNQTSAWMSDFTSIGTDGANWFDGVLPTASNGIGWTNGGASCNTQSLFDGYAAWLMGYNNISGTMSQPASATTGFNVDGFRIDDVSGQSPTFFNQLFLDTTKYNKSTNIFFGEYPTSDANNYTNYTAINTASGNNSSGNTMKMLNFPLLAGLNGAFAYGAGLQASLLSMISSSNAYTSSSNGTLAGSNAINLVMDQDTVPDSFSSRAMCPWTGTNEFEMNYYNAPLAYGIILAMEAGTPFVYADLQAQANKGVNSSGVMTDGLGNGSVSYWNENEVIAGVYFHNQTLGKTMAWGSVNATDGDNVAVLSRGDNYFFIVNKASSVYVASDTSTTLTNGCYIDLMSHQIVNISGGTLNQLIVPAQSVMYFVPYSGAVPSSAGFTCS